MSRRTILLGLAIAVGCSSEQGGSPEPGSARSDYIWKAESSAIRVQHSEGFSYPRSQVTSAWCKELSRSDMTAEQLAILSKLALTDAKACNLCDGWDSYYLAITDLDGAVHEYRSPDCTCGGDISVPHSIPASFFTSFPMSNARDCPE